MKIQEFRDMAAKADRKTLEKMAAEMYKRFSKKQKEEGLDEALAAILKGETPAKPSNAVSFDELQCQIQAFLSNADAGNYFEPNRVIPTKERSKWRFAVMRFLKQLEAVPADSENAEAAAKLYLEIYDRLCYGCGVYIFPSEDPFRSIGKCQCDFYPVLAEKTFATGFTDEKILDMLRAATSVYIDHESMYIELEAAFIQKLRTRDMRERALVIAREEVARLEAKVFPRKSYTEMAEYKNKSDINEICITILGLGIALFEEADALAFFMEHYREHDAEVKLFVALRAIDWFGGSDILWLRTYEDAVNGGVKPRDRLKEAYKERKEGGGKEDE